MNKNIIKVDDCEIEEYKYNNIISINNIDINKIAVPNKLPFSKQDLKYLIG